MKFRPILSIASLLLLAALLSQAADTAGTVPLSRPPPLSRPDPNLDSLHERLKAGQDKAAKWVEPIDPAKAKITFFYLKPDSSQHQPEKDQSNGYFHSWKIIGSQVLTSKEDSQFILAALLRSIHDSDGDVALCFSPAFGLKIETEAGKSVEMAICFHCKSATVYGTEALDGFGVDGPAVDDFLTLVKKLHLDPAEKK